MDISISEQNMDESQDAVADTAADTEEHQHASKKARLSSEAAENMECNSLDQANGNNSVAIKQQDIINPSDGSGVNDSATNATISPELFEKLRKANVSFEQQLKQMSSRMNALIAQSTEKTFDIERLKHQNQKLVNENDDLKKRLDEKIAQINQMEAQQQQQQQKQLQLQPQVDRIAVLEMAKKVKICSTCNAERPMDWLYFCDISCQKRFFVSWVID